MIFLFVLETNPEQLNVFEEAKNSYLIRLVDAGLNKVPPSDKEFSAVTSQEFQDWLKEQDFQGSYKTFRFKKPVQQNQGTKSTKTPILPLSLENNATITGTASILEEFGKEFQILGNHSKLVLHIMTSCKHLTLMLLESTMNSCTCFKSTKRRCTYLRNS